SRCAHFYSIKMCIVSFGFSDVFVQTGSSVQLDIKTQELPKIHVLVWGKDKSATILTFINATKEAIRDGSYKERVEFNTETFSVTLKNMQKTDSGLYTARAIEDNNKLFAEYKVSVIDAVEAPVLTVNSNWSSSDSCTVNFTCRAPELMINSIYQNNRCSLQEVTSHEIHTLILDCSGESIFCNHSNPVSWKEDRMNINEILQIPLTSTFPKLFLSIIITLVMIVCGGLALFCCCKNKTGLSIPHILKN
uniref:Immunoglobulin V-set domain-containing protein n=1 Tax=Cyprinus carpio TaxID=7962 RepID=A0A8C2ENC6_CYPCA